MRRHEETGRVMATYRSAVRHADAADAQDERAAASDQAPAEQSSRRGARPLVPRRQSIAEILQNELVRLIEWIHSDGRVRTDAEVVAELVERLGVRRRGSRVEAAVRAAIAAYRSKR